MALNNQTLESTATAITNDSGEEEEEVDDEELEKLETEAKEMARKILEYRAILPDQLNTAFTSILSAQRPVLPNIDYGSDPGPTGDNNNNNPVLSTSSEKVCLLKERISSNTAAMPILLKRMKDCMSKIDSLDTNNGYIHPAFKRRTS